MNSIFVQYLQNESIIVSSLWPDKQSVMIVHLPKTHAGQTNGSWTYLHNLLRLSLTHSLPHNSLTHSGAWPKGGGMVVRTPHHWPSFFVNFYQTSYKMTVCYSRHNRTLKSPPPHP